MRNIIFRGKATHKGNTPNNWVYGGCLITPMGNSFTIPNTSPKFNSKGEYEAKAIEVCYICQSTGMNDRQGRNIYEGDILKHANMPVYYTVVWDIKLSSFVLYNPKEKHEEFGFDELSPLGRMLRLFPFDKVGNIYDNPEILKKY